MEKKATLKRFFMFLAVTLMSIVFLTGMSFAAEGKSKKINLTCTGASKTSVKLTWETEYPYSSYNIYRSVKGGKFKKVTSTKKKSYKDKKLEKGKQYTYKVVGVYKGKKTESGTKKIFPAKNITCGAYSSEKTHIVISWQYPKKEISAIDGFYVYRKVPGKSSYEKIGTVSKKAYFYYLDKNYTFEYNDTSKKKVGDIYSYKVLPYYGKLKGTGTAIDVTVEPYMFITLKDKKATVNWSGYPKATEYAVRADVYKKNKEGYFEYKGEKDLGTFGKKARNHTFKLDSKKYIYYIYVTAFKGKGSKKEAIAWYGGQSTDDYRTLLTSTKAGKSIDKVKVVNVRGKEKEVAWTEKITKDEKKIFKEFEALHFQKGMTISEKVRYVFNWIHYNTDYDYEYVTSQKYGYVESIFGHKTGQCVQYNGAMVKYLSYLGLTARIIMGYRMENINHYWGEIKLGGRWYCVETGNFKKNGSWSNLCERYENAFGYNICGEIS